MMWLRCWLLALMMLAVHGSAQAMQHPNIVIMLTDDQRWDAVGVVQRALGDRGRFAWMRTATPNMDRLAAEGFRFRNAFVVSAICSPSRAAFLTGRYNHLNGVANNHTPFPVTNVTYATLLRRAGYRTGYFGKWHMGSQRERPGFDQHASYLGQGRYFDAPFLVNGVETRTTGWIDDVSTAYAVDFIRQSATQAVPDGSRLQVPPHAPGTAAAAEQPLRLDEPGPGDERDQLCALRPIA
jgi:arylsulfatase A-like enzyme